MEEGRVSMSDAGDDKDFFFLRLSLRITLKNILGKPLRA